ncbi:hypothetical protein D3875_07340 [Deinococcus cavernae]|uniref:Uncharacterized protein n=1 Tax=Deinococcus cavernae TaxID=2320857 RepID=A0A418V5P0_9DEIO|nr:hypothetical protein [Deinococcus cavernae]RJF71412.1 hypothetical protein D3875_07340 [Deinococcus cavernae]
MHTPGIDDLLLGLRAAHMALQEGEGARMAAALEELENLLLHAVSRDADAQLETPLKLKIHADAAPVEVIEEAFRRFRGAGVDVYRPFIVALKYSVLAQALEITASSEWVEQRVKVYQQRTTPRHGGPDEGVIERAYGRVKKKRAMELQGQGRALTDREMLDVEGQLLPFDVDPDGMYAELLRLESHEWRDLLDIYLVALSVCQLRYLLLDSPLAQKFRRAGVLARERGGEQGEQVLRLLATGWP